MISRIKRFLTGYVYSNTPFEAMKSYSSAEVLVRRFRKKRATHYWFDVCNKVRLTPDATFLTLTVTSFVTIFCNARTVATYCKTSIGEFYVTFGPLNRYVTLYY